MAYIGPTPLIGTVGGTGVNNGTKTITLGGNLATSGAFNATFTLSNTTTVTFPTSGTLATTAQIPSTPISLANGGTNAALTAANGGIFYSTASAGAILAATVTAQQLLMSGASTTPQWSTTTYPLTNAINTILYASSANVMAALATANNGVLITSSGGVPSISSTLPTAVQGNITSTGTLGNQLNTTRSCFLVHMNTTTAALTGDATVANIQFDTTIFDQGSNITLNSSGKTIFTAPVTGRYKFDVCIQTSGTIIAGNDASQVRLICTSRTFLFFFNAFATIDPSATFSCIVDMTSGDIANVALYAPGASKDMAVGGNPTNPVSWFSGYLIC